MRVLPLSIKKGGFLLTQVWRDEAFAIYEQTAPDCPNLRRFEAFAIRIEKKTVNAGHFTVEAGEYYPGTSEWGRTAFSLFSEAQAAAKIDSMRVDTQKRKIEP